MCFRCSCSFFFLNFSKAENQIKKTENFNKIRNNEITNKKHGCGAWCVWCVRCVWCVCGGVGVGMVVRSVECGCGGKTVDFTEKQSKVSLCF